MTVATDLLCADDFSDSRGVGQSIMWWRHQVWLQSGLDFSDGMRPSSPGTYPGREGRYSVTKDLRFD